MFDHPRIVVQPNQVAPFGWYLYSPIRFSDGTQLACYYAEDGFGQRDEIYSAAMMVWNGEGHWLADCQVSKLKLDTDGLPVQWETHLKGEGCSASFSVKIRELPLVRGWGDADPSRDTRQIRRVSTADGSGGRSATTRQEGKTGRRQRYCGVSGAKRIAAQILLRLQTTVKPPREARRSKSVTAASKPSPAVRREHIKDAGTGDGLSKTKTNFGSPRPSAGEDEGLRSLHGGTPLSELVPARDTEPWQLLQVTQPGSCHFSSRSP